MRYTVDQEERSVLTMRCVGRRDAPTGERRGVLVCGGRLPGRGAHLCYDRR